MDVLFVKQVVQIRGTSIGKAIVELTGIEGAERDERQEKLRKILQSLITYINKNPSQRIWENAEVTVYDCEYNIVKISSGSEKNKFIVNEISDDNITIKYVVNNKEQEFPEERSVFENLGKRFRSMKKSIPAWRRTRIVERNMIEQ